MDKNNKNNHPAFGRLALTVLIFFTGLYAILYEVNEILRYKNGGEVDMVHSFYKLKKDSLDVLVIGSSHAYYGFQTNQAWEDYGVASYVMGSPSQTMICSYYLLEEALQYQKPQVVLLESYYFRSGKVFVQDSNLRAVTDNMKNLQNKRELIDLGLPEADWKEKLAYYVPFFKYHSRWKELDQSDFTQKSFYKGSLVRLKHKSFRAPEPTDEKKEIPETALEYFEKIRALCEENDIRLVVFKTPVSNGSGENSDWYHNTMGITNSLSDYLEERSVPYLKLQDQVGIDFENDFYDYCHLSFTGQKKVTAYLMDWLTAQYDLPSHKGDPAYSSYDREYEEFKDYINTQKTSGSEDRDDV